ncbi:hypothetical protein GI584_14760 [Gracilibacillus salitolerans]|uniref:Uncharacterized protein n=1 Tax=Gracilibacillus salitolerans TaxID=2663022 RepID=A0A5Q2TM55_9BACI|nr:hypothetical protein [Gracilibacillus salitolerans]QGH35231.1 hypothetical protein GI584_14760 [Gracilibacillus salitolerans]
MKKSKRDQQSFDINQMITQYMKDYMGRMSNEEYKKNNSFIYLENETLHMLLMYLFMKNNSNSMDSTNVNLSELSEILDRHVESNRQGYEEVIQLLKVLAKGSSEND